MTIAWFNPSEKLPNDGEECLLMPRDHQGMMTVGVFGPIPWSEKNKCWLDLFRDPEAGSLLYPHDVGCWTLWEPIAPPEGLPRPTEPKPPEPPHVVPVQTVLPKRTLLDRIKGWWHARQRAVDLDVLWPACKSQAPSIDMAKVAFACHAFRDPAWLALPHDDVVAMITELQ